MKRLALTLIVLALLIPHLGLALDTSTRSVSPVMSWTVVDLENFDAQWLHFKCVEDLRPVLSAGQFSEETGRDLSSLNVLVAGAAELRRTFPGPREHFRELKARGESASGRIGPDLSRRSGTRDRTPS